jgi:hypothetical protein
MGHRDLLVTHTILLPSADRSYFYPREASAAPAASFLSLALIGNASAHESRGEELYPSRGVFDKETRRKPLAFAADAGYGN